MTTFTQNNKTISDQCREWAEKYPDVLETWKKYGDSFQKAAAATIEAGIRGEIEA